MNELEQFIKEYQQKTFDEILEEKKVDKKAIKHFQDISIKASTINESERTVEVIATSEVEDRQGDIVKISGASLDNFVKNPVILFGHDSASLPVARAVGIKIEDQHIVMKLEFPTKEVYEFADTVFKMVKSGYIRAVSIGFIPLKQSYDEELKAYVIEKWELLETSIVPVPANQEALIKDYQENKSKFNQKGDTKKEAPTLQATEDEVDDYENIQEKKLEALKLYRKYQVKLRDILGIQATEDEVETIKEVFNSVVGVCNVIKNIKQTESQTSDEGVNLDGENPSENHEEKSLMEKANDLY